MLESSVLEYHYFFAVDHQRNAGIRFALYFKNVAVRNDRLHVELRRGRTLCPGSRRDCSRSFNPGGMRYQSRKRETTRKNYAERYA